MHWVKSLILNRIGAQKYRQNSVIRLQSNTLAPKKFLATPQFFGLAAPLHRSKNLKYFPNHKALN